MAYALAGLDHNDRRQEVTLALQRNLLSGCRFACILVAMVLSLASSWPIYEGCELPQCEQFPAVSQLLWPASLAPQ